MRILLVEDDNRVADALTGALRRNGYEVRRAANAADALAAPAVDLVLLDLGLPDRDGIEVCRELRARGGVPVIAVTARGGEPDRVRGLRSGADDYVVKPFGTAELLARIEAVLRRSMSQRAHEDRLVTIDGLAIDLGRRTVTLDGQPVRLTRKEFDVLAALVRADGAAVPRDRIVVEVWQTTYDGMSRTLDVHVATLRGKLGRAGSVVRTVRGFGYRLATANGVAADGASAGPPASAAAPAVPRVPGAASAVIPAAGGASEVPPAPDSVTAVPPVPDAARAVTPAPGTGPDATAAPDTATVVTAAPDTATAVTAARDTAPDATPNPDHPTSASPPTAADA